MAYAAAVAFALVGAVLVARHQAAATIERNSLRRLAELNRCDSSDDCRDLGFVRGAGCHVFVGVSWIDEAAAIQSDINDADSTESVKQRELCIRAAEGPLISDLPLGRGWCGNAPRGPVHDQVVGTLDCVDRRCVLLKMKPGCEDACWERVPKPDLALDDGSSSSNWNRLDCSDWLADCRYSAVPESRDNNPFELRRPAQRKGLECSKFCDGRHPNGRPLVITERDKITGKRVQFRIDCLSCATCRKLTAERPLMMSIIDASARPNALLHENCWRTRTCERGQTCLFWYDFLRESHWTCEIPCEPRNNACPPPLECWTVNDGPFSTCQDNPLPADGGM